MAQLFVNNLSLTLAANVTTSQLTLDVVSTTGLPVFNVGDWFYLTLTDIREGGELRWEIVKVTSWTGTTLTVVRGQDGTTAQAWSAGAKASLRVTAADMRDLETFKDGLTPQALLTSIKTVDGPGSGLDADLLDGRDSSDFATARNRSNWNDNTVINQVSGQLSWKNYGNGHTIFDASNSTSPDGTSVNSANPQMPWSPTFPTLMGWSGAITFGVRVDSARNADLLDGIDSNGFAKAGGNSGALTIGTNDASALTLETNGTGRVTVDASGNVGIGTSSPVHRLTVDKGAIYVTNYQATPYSETPLLIGSQHINAITIYGTGLAGVYHVSYDGLHFGRMAGLSFKTSTMDAQPQERMRITSDGNLLIGTTTDNGTDRLQVNGAICSGNVGIREYVFTGVTPNATGLQTLVLANALGLDMSKVVSYSCVVEAIAGHWFKEDLTYIPDVNFSVYVDPNRIAIHTLRSEIINKNYKLRITVTA